MSVTHLCMRWLCHSACILMIEIVQHVLLVITAQSIIWLSQSYGVEYRLSSRSQPQESLLGKNIQINYCTLSYNTSWSKEGNLHFTLEWIIYKVLGGGGGGNNFNKPKTHANRSSCTLLGGNYWLVKSSILSISSILSMQC